MDQFFEVVHAEQESSRSDRTKAEVVRPDVMDDILSAGRVSRPMEPVPGRAAARQSRKSTRRATKIVDDLFGDLDPAEGGHLRSEAVCTLRNSLKIVDPDYVRAQQALKIVGAVRTGLARQGKDKTSRGVARALGDLVSDGAASGEYSTAAARALLGVSVRRRKASSELACTAGSFDKARKKHKSAFGINVKKAIAEFAFAYCKFEEKKFVSVLPAIQVWELYCTLHDEGGAFYSMGNFNVLPVHTHYQSLCIAHCTCRARVGSPEYLDWLAAKAQAQVRQQPFDTKQPRPLSSWSWYQHYPKSISTEKWRSCVCHLCSEVEDLVNTWGVLMSACHSRPDDPVRRGEVGRKLNVRCSHAGCRWNLPSDDLRSLTLPDRWPSRFKNLVTSPTIAEALQLRLPTLFCSPCGCGCCQAEERQEKSKIGIEVRS